MNGLIQAKLQRAFDAGLDAYRSGRWRGQNPYAKSDDRLSVEWQAGVLAGMHAKGGGTKLIPQLKASIQRRPGKHGPVRHLKAS